MRQSSQLLEKPRNWLAFVVLIATLVIVAIACTSLSPIWNYPNADYFPINSTYSLLPPNFPSDTFVLKLYVDVVVFYAWLFGTYIFSF